VQSVFVKHCAYGIQFSAQPSVSSGRLHGAFQNLEYAVPDIAKLMSLKLKMFLDIFFIACIASQL